MFYVNLFYLYSVLKKISPYFKLLSAGSDRDVTVNISKILNTFLVLFPSKMCVIKADIHKMLIRTANREGPDQTASSEAV